MNRYSEKNPFASDLPLNSIPETDFEPDHKWGDIRTDSPVTASRDPLSDPPDAEPQDSLFSEDPLSDPPDADPQDSLSSEDPFSDSPDADPQDSLSSQDPLSHQHSSSRPEAAGERLPESGETGSGQSAAPLPESRDEEEQTFQSKAITVLLVFIVIQLLIILLILCRNKGII